MKFSIVWLQEFSAYKVSIPEYPGGEVVTIDEYQAAEARAADLAESNREQAEAITTLRAERDDQATRIIELEATTAAYKIGNDELKRIIDTLRSERNEAWSSLKETRDTIQDLTL